MPTNERPKIGFRIRFNQTTNRRSRGKDTPLKEFYDRLEAAVKDVALDKVTEVIISNSQRIKEEVEKSLLVYIRGVLRFFFSIESPNALRYKNTKIRRINRENVIIRYQDKGVFNATARAVTPKQLGNLKSTPSGFSVIWQALAPSTILRKRSPSTRGTALTFFVDSGELRRDMEVILPELFQEIVGFNIEVENDLKNPHDRVTIRALPTSRAMSLLGQNGVITDNVGQTDLMMSFLKGMSKASIIRKLLNGPGESKPERPFIQQALSFWLLRRFPSILDQSIRSALRRIK